MMKATLLFHAALLFAAAANACDQPPFSERYENRGTATWTQGDGGCELQSTLLADDLATAGVAHFRRRDGSAPLHMSFRLDLSELTSVNSIQWVSIASATSKASVGTGSSASADLLRLSVFGNLQGTSRTLGIVAACEGQPGGCMASAPLESDAPIIGLRLNIGSGDGLLQVWIDSDFDGPPTVSLQGLDNAAWAGVERVVLGLSSASGPFLTNHVGETVRFDQVAMTLTHPIGAIDANRGSDADDQVFHVGFESPGTPGCGDDALPILKNSTMVGTTCGGENEFPSIASGSTRANAPETVFKFTQDTPANISLTLHSEHPSVFGMFVCPSQCGPAAPCIAGTAGASGLIDIPQLAAGDYFVVVKAVGTNLCGEFQLDAFGPLD
jgi:hypothetical protein